MAGSDPETPQTTRCHRELGQLFPSHLENRSLGTGQGSRHTHHLTHIQLKVIWLEVNIRGLVLCHAWQQQLSSANTNSCWKSHFIIVLPVYRKSTLLPFEKTGKRTQQADTGFMGNVVQFLNQSVSHLTIQMNRNSQPGIRENKKRLLKCVVFKRKIEVNLIIIYFFRVNYKYFFIVNSSGGFYLNLLFQFIVVYKRLENIGKCLLTFPTNHSLDHLIKSSTCTVEIVCYRCSVQLQVVKIYVKVPK